MRKGLYIIILLISSCTAFSQKDPKPAVVYVEEEAEDDCDVNDEVIDFPSEEAQFKGGAVNMQRFIAKHIKFPEEAIDKNIQGRVYMKFVVLKNGKVTDVEVERGVHPALDQAAKDVIEKMPKWKPGKCHGVKVNTRVRVPIIFQIQ